MALALDWPCLWSSYAYCCRLLVSCGCRGTRRGSVVCQSVPSWTAAFKVGSGAQGGALSAIRTRPCWSLCHAALAYRNLLPHGACKGCANKCMMSFSSNCPLASTKVTGNTTTLFLLASNRNAGLCTCVSLCRWHDQIPARVLQHCGVAHVQGDGGPLP